MRYRNTTRLGQRFNEATVEAVWRKGRPIAGYSSEVYRRDACGTTMQRSAYGDTNAKFGWEVDHIVPVAKGGSDDLSNLQPLHWQNNRSKGDDWPNWSCAV